MTFSMCMEEFIRQMCFRRSLCTLEKKFILLSCAHTFIMHIFRIEAHVGISIQCFFICIYAIFQNVHKKRWMETQLVTSRG